MHDPSIRFCYVCTRRQLQQYCHIICHSALNALQLRLIDSHRLSQFCAENIEQLTFIQHG